MLKLQPLRVVSGWTIEWNTFMEVDPSPDDMSPLSGSSLLHTFNEQLRRAINLEWRPEEDFEGEFILQVIDLYEEFNFHTKKVDLSGIWDDIHYEFRSKNRLEIVAEIERLMLQLKPYQDPRILKSPGVIDDIAEPLRLKLEELGVNNELANQIIASDNKFIQDLLIDHKSVRKTDLEKLVKLGATKGVKRKVEQKLNSKAFKSNSNS